MAEIKLESVAKSFGAFSAVKDVSFAIDHGSFFVILGPSGCGKTTTLRMIAGLELPTAGRILLDGDDVTALRASARDIAFVFQLFALYPHMNVRQNIGFPLRCQNYPRAQIRQSVEETARLLRIDHLLDRRVGVLSGGDRQLVAMAMADRIAIMNQGRIEQIGTPQEIYDRPRTMFVADFIGAPPMSFLGVQAGPQRGDRSIRIDGVAVEMPEVFEDRAEGRFMLGVRPENVSFADASMLR